MNISNLLHSTARCFPEAPAVSLGDAKVHPCSMAMDVLALEPAALEPWLAEPLGLTKFLDDAADAQSWSF